MTFTSSPGGRAGHGAGRTRRPLVIAVDGTLVSCDLTFELLIAYLKADPRSILDVLGWLGRGRGYVRLHLDERVPMDADSLPVNATLVAFAKDEAAAGCPVYLASSTNSRLLEALKERLPFVAGVITLAASEPGQTTDRHMAEEIARRFPDGFNYAGSSAADLNAWQRAGSAVLVGASPQIARRAAALVPVSASLPGPSRFKGLVDSLRLHQWAKNLLVFAPLVLGGKLDELGALLAAIMAFVAMGLVASSTYLINDILDVADDRRHWSKRERPVAAGQLAASAAAASAGVGLTIGLAVASAISGFAVTVLLFYVGLTLSYSLGLKRLPLIDGLVLAVQYTLRLALGVVAAQVPPSPWLFVFSMFLFMSLSLAKRYTELGRLGLAGTTKISGRGYRAEDAPLVLAVGVAAGLGAVVIIILYIIDDAFRQTFYGRTLWLWGFPPLVFLVICRIWLVTVRGDMHDDPVRFMLADRASQYLLAALLVCFVLAWLG